MTTLAKGRDPTTEFTHTLRPILWKCHNLAQTLRPGGEHYEAIEAESHADALR